MQSKHTSPVDDCLLGTIVLLGSGMAALGHEILWTRRMIDLLGASTESSARVFECFFLGLSLGAALISPQLANLRRPWNFLGVLELGVGFLCLPALLLPSWSGWIWPSLGATKLLSWQGPAIKTALSVLVLLPPTLLMGMTLPAMVYAIASYNSHQNSREIRLYAANTLGGVFGLALVVLILLQSLGGFGSMLAMIAINLVNAVICFYRNRLTKAYSSRGYEPKLRRDVSHEDVRSRMLRLILSFLSGAGVLGTEVLALALTNLSAPLSFYPQAAILGCIILVLALAAWLVARLAVRSDSVTRKLTTCLAASGLAITIVPIIFLNLPGVRDFSFAYGLGFAEFLKRLTARVFAAFGPAVFLAGMVFPLSVSWSRARGGPAGRELGLMLGVSGLGGIAGAELAYRVLLPNFSVHISIGLVGVYYCLSSIGVLLTLTTKSIRHFLFPMAALITACYLTSNRLSKLPVYFKQDVFKLVDLRVGREGSLAVPEDQGGARNMVFDNQYTLGGSEATPSLRRQAHLPLMFHPAPTDVGFIGLGTGITASGAVEHQAVKSITVVELSSLVAQAAKADFARFNHDLFHDPRVKVYVEDARIYLESAREHFDVIVGDLFTPWRPGEASLSSLEQFRAAREALRPGGVFCQWVELTQWTPEQFQVAAATFRSAFGHLYLLRTGFTVEHLPLGLLGFKDRSPDWNSVGNRCRFEAAKGHVVDPLCRNPDGIAMLYLGEYLPPPESGIQLNTLNNFYIELSASRQLVAGREEDYFSGLEPSGRWYSFLENQVREIQARRELPDALRQLPLAGIEATSLESALKSNAAADTIATIAKKLAVRIPQEIRTDSNADWSLWPGSLLPWAPLDQKSTQ